VVRLLWDVVFADARIDQYEEHLVRKVADLLYVSHTRRSSAPSWRPRNGLKALSTG